MPTPVVLITGALTGIGRATALIFAHEGRRSLSLAGATRKVRSSSLNFANSGLRRNSYAPTFVTKTMYAALLIRPSRFGRLDVAVNNAGTEGTPGPVMEQTAETYAAIFDTNVLGTLLSMKHELRVMLAQGHGSIVNVSSTYGRSGGVVGASVYVASKHAVEGLTKAAALEVAESGVRINAVAPGPIETGMLNRLTGNAENKADMISRVPVKRLGQPEEIAHAIVFLASDKASFITGASLAVDGGKLAR